MRLREEQVGINLRYFRECDGLTVEAMAQKLHLTVAQLEALERGEAEASVPLCTLATVYNKYGVNPEQLFMPLHHVIAGRLMGE